VQTLEFPADEPTVPAPRPLRHIFTTIVPTSDLFVNLPSATPSTTSFVTDEGAEYRSRELQPAVVQRRAHSTSARITSPPNRILPPVPSAPPKQLTMPPMPTIAAPAPPSQIPALTPAKRISQPLHAPVGYLKPHIYFMEYNYEPLPLRRSSSRQAHFDIAAAHVLRTLQAYPPTEGPILRIGRDDFHNVRRLHSKPDRRLAPGMTVFCCGELEGVWMITADHYYADGLIFSTWIDRKVRHRTHVILTPDQIAVKPATGSKLRRFLRILGMGQ
jgi:hypothetical protein